MTHRGILSVRRVSLSYDHALKHNGYDEQAQLGLISNQETRITS